MRGYRALIGKLACAVGVAAFLLLPTESLAAHDNPRGNITELVSGWEVANLLIIMDQPFYNPDNCPNSYGYEIPANSPGNQLHASLAIMAFSANKKIWLVTDGCSDGVPKVISVHVIN